MTVSAQAQSFGDIRIEGQGNSLVINQVIQIAASEVKSRPFCAASPYRGLRAFQESDKDVFFGRNATVLQLLRAVAQHALLMISGASGSGKSSVVYAGLLPQLARRVQGFRSFKMKPGSDPFEWLKWALLQGGEKEPKVKFAGTAHESTLPRVAALCPPTECWLLFIDQFEELFTLCENSETRDAFLSGLLAVTAAPKDRFKIVLTMRSDFFDRFDLYPELLDQVRLGLRFVTSPTPEELRQCIEQPAAQHGVIFEEGLAEQILSELKGRPGTLPLLQYALDLLWTTDKPDDDKTLNKSSYAAIGGVTGALCQRADAVYTLKEELPRSEDGQQAMRRVFLRLVEVSGQGDSAPIVSKRRELALFSESEQAIVQDLVEEKLLISSAEQKSGVFEKATVELAHESLLHAWPKLDQWLKEARHVLYVRNRLSYDALEWQRLRRLDDSHSRRADEELWTGTRLAQALELRARGDFQSLLGGLNADEEAFLNASEARKTRQEQEEKDRLGREREAAEKTRQLLLDTYVARGHRFLFEKNQPYPAALWLHRAYKQDSKNPILPHLLKTAMQHVDVMKVVLSGHGDSVRSAQYSPDGRRIVTASADNTARVWDARDGRLLTELASHGYVNSAQYSPDGRRIVTASTDNTARVWDAETGLLLADVNGN